VQVRAGKERLGLSARAFGYGEPALPLPAVAPRAERNRVFYRRGSLTEWYANGPLGLEQGFTLASAPTARGSGPLTLVLKLTGTLAPALEPSRRGLRFADSSLRFRGLFAADARGRSLPAWLELRARTLLVRVDDAGARYPLTIDPLFQQAKLTASDWAEGDLFGASVAISGDTVVVGAPEDDVGANFNQGSVYVFVKRAAGWASMTQTAKLTASDRAVRLGFSIAIAGDTVVAGAPFDSGGAHQGSAYVFVKPAAGWANMTQTAKLTASDGWGSDHLGASVAVSGNTVVAGAPNDGDLDNRALGSAYVFVKPAAGWANMTQTAKLTASDPAWDDVLGSSVAVSGNTVVAGAPTVYGANPGSAYVFVKPAAGWVDMTQTAKLTASDGRGSDELGSSVAASGDTVVAGAFGDDVGANADQGSAYVFVKPAAGWVNMTQTAKLTASDGARSDQLGRSVTVSGNTVVAGAFWGNVGANLNQGSAYVFVKPAAGWVNMTQTAKLTASDGARSDQLGRSVTVAGDTVVAGTSRNPVQASGPPSAYAFVKPAAGWARAAGCIVSNVVGKTLAAAKAAISRGRCATGLVRRAYSRRMKKGHVIAQRPRPRTRLPRGGRVHLVVSRGRKPPPRK
jgi:hypothetical protein